MHFWIFFLSNQYHIKLFGLNMQYLVNFKKKQTNQAVIFVIMEHLSPSFTFPSWLGSSGGLVNWIWTPFTFFPEFIRIYVQSLDFKTWWHKRKATWELQLHFLSQKKPRKMWGGTDISKIYKYPMSPPEQHIHNEHTKKHARLSSWHWSILIIIYIKKQQHNFKLQG